MGAPRMGGAPVTAVNVDGQMWIAGAHRGIASGGVWALNVAGGNTIRRRTPAAGSGWWNIEFDLPARTAALRGRKITSVTAVYSVGVATLDDVAVQLYRQAVPADGVQMAAKSLLPVTYDGNHDTAAKRGSFGAGTQYHTCVATVDTPTYIGDDQGYYVTFMVDGDAGALGTLDFYGLLIRYDETLTP